MPRRLRVVLLGAGLGLLQACTLPTSAERGAAVVELAASRGWTPHLVSTDAFELQAFLPPGHLTDTPRRLAVYVEGDGLAWVGATTPSLAPTPSDPVGLRLAMAHTGGLAAYLGRPCQYTQGEAFRRCHPRYWTTHRFSPEVVDAMDQAVEQLKRRSGATELVLVGYSGGAAVVALLAARRSDVVAWVTVAGVLDTDAWTRTLGLSSLHGSQNPVAFASRLSAVPQWHFTGSRDRVVPLQVLQRFLAEQARTPSAVFPQVQRLEGFDHNCCWAAEWPMLSQRIARPDPIRNLEVVPPGPASGTTR